MKTTKTKKDKLHTIFLACEASYKNESEEIRNKFTLVEYIKTGYAYRDDNKEGVYYE